MAGWGGVVLPMSLGTCTLTCCYIRYWVGSGGANKVLVLDFLVICTLAYVLCHDNREYVAMLAHGSDATLADVSSGGIVLPSSNLSHKKLQKACDQAESPDGLKPSGR